MTRWPSSVSIALIVLGTAACSSESGNAAAGKPSPASSAASTAAAGGLTPFELEHGIGPIKSPVALAATPDETLASHGEKVFEQKCAACHKMAERYVGPALGDVTKRRTPAFVMNMALNPLGMVEKHPETKKLLAEYFVAMPNQNVSSDEARQVVEYLRTQAH